MPTLPGLPAPLHPQAEGSGGKLATVYTLMDSGTAHLGAEAVEGTIGMAQHVPA